MPAFLARAAISLPTAAAAAMLPVPFKLPRKLLVERRRADDDAVAFGRDDLRVDVLRRAVHAQPMNAEQRDAHASAAGAALTFRFLGRSP